MILETEWQRKKRIEAERKLFSIDPDRTLDYRIYWLDGTINYRRFKSDYDARQWAMRQPKVDAVRRRNGPSVYYKPTPPPVEKTYKPTPEIKPATAALSKFLKQKRTVLR